MRALILLFIILLAALVASSPVDPERVLVIRPETHEVFRRSPQGVKGHVDRGGVKGHKPAMPSVRKGEYICGNKVCRLQPGVVPRGCNGVCQYPVK